jgi:stage V sporulation protein G
MRITEVRVTLKHDPRLLGYASITLEDCFVVRSLKIIQGQDGRIFVAMPSRRKKNGEYQDIAHPINHAFRKTLEDTVLDKYNPVLQEVGEEWWKRKPPHPPQPDR